MTNKSGLLLSIIILFFASKELFFLVITETSAPPSVWGIFSYLIDLVALLFLVAAIFATEDKAKIYWFLLSASYCLSMFYLDGFVSALLLLIIQCLLSVITMIGFYFLLNSSSREKEGSD